MAVEFNRKKFAGEINRSARETYPSLQSREHPIDKVIPTRLALRSNTPYPYRFHERDEMYPSDDANGFGGIIRKDRESGLREIHTKIAEADFEHSWLFIPERELWVDNTHGARDIVAITDQKLVPYLSQQYHVVEMVHTHPDKVGIRQYEEGDANFTANWLMKSAPPSIVDLLILKKLSQKSNPDGMLQTSVVSHYGVTSTVLNDEGKRAEETYFRVSDYPTSSMGDPIDEIEFLVQDTSRRTINTDNQVPIFDMTFVPLSKK